MPPGLWQCRRSQWDGPIPRLPLTPTTARWCSSTKATKLTVQAGEEGIRFLLVSGKPLEEPVAWYGPIVMNTQEQLREAFTELEQGTFLKSAER